jgi:hypothetical protein
LGKWRKTQAAQRNLNEQPHHIAAVSVSPRPDAGIIAISLFKLLVFFAWTCSFLPVNFLIRLRKRRAFYRWQAACRKSTKLPASELTFRAGECKLAVEEEADAQNKDSDR